MGEDDLSEDPNKEDASPLNRKEFISALEVTITVLKELESQNLDASYQAITAESVLSTFFETATIYHQTDFIDVKAIQHLVELERLIKVSHDASLQHFCTLQELTRVADVVEKSGSKNELEKWLQLKETSLVNIRTWQNSLNQITLMACHLQDQFLNLQRSLIETINCFTKEKAKKKRKVM